MGRGRGAYQQSSDQFPHVVSHASSLGVTGGQLDQRYQEVLALLHTFQSLLLIKMSNWRQSLSYCCLPKPSSSGGLLPDLLPGPAAHRWRFF